MTKVYPAIIHEEDGYWVEFPDLEGCYTDGESLEDLMKNAQDVLGLFLASLYDRNIDIPCASPISDISTETGIVTYVSTDVNKYRRDTQAVKKMLSIPSWLAKEAEANNISLSKVLQEALMAKLNVL